MEHFNKKRKTYVYFLGIYKGIQFKLWQLLELGKRETQYLLVAFSLYRLHERTIRLGCKYQHSSIVYPSPVLIVKSDLHSVSGIRVWQPKGKAATKKPGIVEEEDVLFVFTDLEDDLILIENIFINVLGSFQDMVCLGTPWMKDTRSCNFFSTGVEGAL